MSEITVKGYCNKPQSKSGSKGGFSTFTLAERQKNGKKGEPPNFTKNYFNVTDFNNASPPAESSFVTVTGYLKFRTYTKDGVERVSYDIVANTVEVADGSGGPKASAGAEGAPPAATPEPDPWD